MSGPLYPSFVQEVTEPAPGYDVIGDVHGCAAHLIELLSVLGYTFSLTSDRLFGHALFGGLGVTHPQGRKPVFVGDLVDRGPYPDQVLSLVSWLWQHQQGYAVLGNHDYYLLRALTGSFPHPPPYVRATVERLMHEHAPEDVLSKTVQLLSHLPYLTLLDGGNLRVVHGAYTDELLDGRTDRERAKEIALFGLPTGEVDAHGFDVRADWSRAYHGKPWIVYGHTVRQEPYAVGHAIGIDLGACFGGKLAAFRYPELEVVGFDTIEHTVTKWDYHNVQ